MATSSDCGAAGALPPQNLLVEMGDLPRGRGVIFLLVANAGSVKNAVTKQEERTMTLTLAVADPSRRVCKALVRGVGKVVGLAVLFGAAPAFAEEIDSSIARGGRLYDKWWAATKASAPKGPHPAYPLAGKYRGKEGTDWRCKECHGWDYMGNAGAYAKGSHFTGIKGIEAAAGKDPAAIVATLKDKTHALDGSLADEHLRDLALFVSKGQVRMDQYIDRASKKAKGDAVKGAAVFNTICANCHGVDGTLDEDGKPLPADGEPLGLVANDNPWEALHKIRNGQPGERMPALRAFDIQVALDVLAHLQTLPTKIAAQKK
jgi:thiosulfate dehydrogenase